MQIFEARPANASAAARSSDGATSDGDTAGVRSARDEARDTAPRSLRDLEIEIATTREELDKGEHACTEGRVLLREAAEPRASVQQTIRATYTDLIVCYRRSTSDP